MVAYSFPRHEPLREKSETTYNVPVLFTGGIFRERIKMLAAESC